MKNSIALIGFMAVGKSTVGKLLAVRSGKTFIEVDSLIEEMAGKSVSRIFKEEGEITFREYEIAAIKQVSTRRNLVVACGGGVVLNKINIDRLKQDSVIVWLIASTKTIVKRLDLPGEIRPLIAGNDPEKEVWSLLNFRQPFYERAADMQVDTSEISIEQITEKILKKWETYADHC
jgi:shikimate kinase